MLDRAARWLSERDYRSAIINVVMLTAVLALAGSGTLFQLVGGGAIIIATLHFLLRAVRLTVNSRGAANFYQVALIWIPGILAVCLAIIGLYFVTVSEPMSLGYLVGVILFGCEAAMLAIAGADLDNLVSVSPVPAEAA
jgi:hypothetical protein